MIFALLMMVKDESSTIYTSLNSVTHFADAVVILDTGSTDDTILKIREWCNKHNKYLFITEKTFNPFHYHTARNYSLDYLDSINKSTLDVNGKKLNEKISYALLLDANDEMRDGTGLKNYLTEYKGDAGAFHICQIWKSNNGKTFDKYYNVRVVRIGGGWRYKRKVHEYMSHPTIEKFNKEMFARKRQGLPMLNNPYVTRIEASVFTIFQDRANDDAKSAKRFKRDKEFFVEDYVEEMKKTETQRMENEDEYSRTLFYLAQTLTCVFELRDAYTFYRKRVKYAGFNEEVFHSYYRNGEISRALQHHDEERILWYLKAIYYSQAEFVNMRVEPLVRLAEYYIMNDNLQMAFYYLQLAFIIPYPEELILFVDKHMYDYNRYFLLAKIGNKIGKNKLGFICLLQCIRCNNSNNMPSTIELEMIKEYTNEKYSEDWLKNSDNVKLLQDVVPTYGNVSTASKYVKFGQMENNVDSKILWYIKAMEVSCKEIGLPDMEAQLCLGELFLNGKVKLGTHPIKVAIMYFKFTFEIPDHSSFNKYITEYLRLHYFSKVAYVFNLMTEGRNACINAILHAGDYHNSFINEDYKTLEYYIKNDSIRNEVINACKTKDLQYIQLLLQSPNLMDISKPEENVEKIKNLQQLLKNKIK